MSGGLGGALEEAEAFCGLQAAGPSACFLLGDGWGFVDAHGIQGDTVRWEGGETEGSTISESMVSPQRTSFLPYSVDRVLF